MATRSVERLIQTPTLGGGPAPSERTTRALVSLLAPPPGQTILTGDGAQVFNDRARRDETTAGPFDPLQADRIDLEVWASGQVVVTLQSWGSGTLNFFATCGSNGVWTGTTGAGATTFMLSMFAAMEPRR
jgi:hypothetical protein